MSQCGGVPAVGRSVSPGSLKRKRGIADYTSSRISQRVKLAEAAPSHDPRPAGDLSSHKQYPSPDSDEPRRTEPGDNSFEATSTSLLNKAASSAFGHTPQAAPSNKAPSFPNGLTPLTNHSDSSPAITCSPRAVPDLVDMSATNGAHESSDVRPSDATQTSSNPRAERPSMHLPPDQVKGYRAVWDPELGTEQKKGTKTQMEKKGRPKPASMKKFEVRNRFHNPPSLRNMIQTQEIGKITALYPFADTG
jgi:histone-lysine N-methyltransferase SETD1